jgi:SAM-dependent methyltransferase
MDKVRGEPLLDLGVGAGRTVPLLRALSHRYTAIDYLPEMVACVQRRYPSIDVSVGDARDLSRFHDHSFAMVTFSFNGIDSINHAGRRRVLAEAHRVLRPGGLLWFSTLNQQGPNHRERPWRPRPPREMGGLRAYPMVALRSIWRLPRAAANFRRTRDLREAGDGWDISVLSAHDYGMVVHYTTLARQLTELAALGFTSGIDVFGSDGAPVGPRTELSRVGWFQILARR